MAANSAGGSSSDNSEIVQSIQRLLHLVTSSGRHQSTNSGVTTHTEGEQRQGSHTNNTGPERPSVQMEMTRSFPGIFARGRGKRRFPAASYIPAKKIKPLEVVFHLLPKQYERSPSEEEQIVHLQAGLGRRTAQLYESTTHDELCEALNVLFPKLAAVTGGWLVYKCRGGWGSRKLSLVAPDSTGYTGKILKLANKNGNATLFIAPIQEELSTDPLHPTDKAFSSMPKATCQKCTEAVPLQLLTVHIQSCAGVDANEPVVNKSLQQCPLCTEMFSTDFIEEHASSCGER
ncbi:uncharacterized protein LOC105354611 isoform X2 [Oryzias latipes]|uniref:uncharacterized protein LOC105354611 isoform X2 n=1 Tax=Oryzias latipes TaxID=8090 RepID=UPI000CE20A49|nr:uncharacterized protein LOC105354611 isoform X2 [Oryzias latipes]